MAVRMNGDVAIFNVEAEREISLLQQVDDLISHRVPFFVASVSYEDIDGEEFESIFVSAQDELGEICYFAALLQPEGLPLVQIWEVPPAVWLVEWSDSSGIVFSSDEEKICALRCDDEEFLYDLIMSCEESYGDVATSESTEDKRASENSSTHSVNSETIESDEKQPLTMAEWFTQEYDQMTVDQILQNIDEWSVGVLRETYNYEQSRRMRPKVLSKIIEYLGFVGEDPRNTAAASPTNFPADMAQSDESENYQENLDAVSFEWGAIQDDEFPNPLYKVERTSDGGRTWISLGTTSETTFVDQDRRKNTTDIYKLSVSDSDEYFFIQSFYSPIKSPMDQEEILRIMTPYRGEISEQIQKLNAKVLRNDKGTLQVHCPFCGTFTEKTIYSKKGVNRSIDNANKSLELQRKARKRQRQGEKLIALGGMLSLSARGSMMANQIETNHLIQDQLQNELDGDFEYQKNSAEIECKNCGILVDEV